MISITQRMAESQYANHAIYYLQRLSNNLYNAADDLVEARLSTTDETYYLCEHITALQDFGQLIDKLSGMIYNRKEQYE